jgi:hypothetical protein
MTTFPRRGPGPDLPCASIPACGRSQSGLSAKAGSPSPSKCGPRCPRPRWTFLQGETRWTSPKLPEESPRSVQGNPIQRLTDLRLHPALPRQPLGSPNLLLEQQFQYWGKRNRFAIELVGRVQPRPGPDRQRGVSGPGRSISGNAAGLVPSGQDRPSKSLEPADVPAVILRTGGRIPWKSFATCTMFPGSLQTPI